MTGCAKTQMAIPGRCAAVRKINSGRERFVHGIQQEVA
jgi:hypothetical protein